jgi:predicted Zn-dependent protease
MSRKDMLLSMLAKEPDDVFFNYALAIEYVGEKKFHEAEEQFLKTLKLNPEYLPVYYQLGQTFEKLGKKKRAVEIYFKGLELAKKQKNQKAVNEINEAMIALEE